VPPTEITMVYVLVRNVQRGGVSFFFLMLKIKNRVCDLSGKGTMVVQVTEVKREIINIVYNREGEYSLSLSPLEPTLGSKNI
jgi:hypothetical protein